MSQADDKRSFTQSLTSWAKVASADKEQPRTTSVEVRLSVPQIQASTSDPQQARFHHLEDQVHRLQAELKRQKANNSERSAEERTAAAKIVKLESTLSHARRKLLSLQPPQEVFDDEVKQAFDDLCHNIEDFVDIECGNLTDLEECFSEKHWTDKELRIIESHITEDEIEFSKDFPSITSNVIMSAVFSLMYDCALREDRWGALADRKEEELLNKLVERMSTQKSFYNIPARGEAQSGLNFADNAQLRRWRSETFRALRGDQTRMTLRQAGMKESLRRLYLMLQHFVDEHKTLKHERLRSKILEPAYLLGDMIKRSTSGYRLDFVVSSSNRNLHLEVERATLHKLVDANTGAGYNPEMGDKGRVGELRLCVFPALVKVQEDGEELCMSKALVVVDGSDKSNGRL